MALINCPECGAQVSDRAPSCPHCGFPLSADAASAAPVTAAAATGATPGTGANPNQSPYQSESESPSEPPVPAIEPFRIRLAGRPIPIAFILFFGGMTLGTIIALGFPVPDGVEPAAWRREVPMAMVWAGVLWFAVTEFIALLRNRMRRR